MSTATSTGTVKTAASLSLEAEALLSRLRLGPARLSHVADLLHDSGTSKLSKSALLTVLRFELWQAGFFVKREVDDGGRLWFWLADDPDAGQRTCKNVAR